MYKQNSSYKDAVEKDQLAMLPMFHPEQFGLDPLPRIINDASETKAEALRILEKYLEQQQWDVYLAFKQLGFSTDWEVSRKLGIERSSVCARRNTLVKLGLIEKHDTIKVERGKRIVENTRWKTVIKIPAVLVQKKIFTGKSDE